MNREAFINKTHRNNFTTRGFKVGARVGTRASQNSGVSMGTVIDADSPDLLVHWDDKDQGTSTEVHYLHVTIYP